MIKCTAWHEDNIIKTNIEVNGTSKEIANELATIMLAIVKNFKLNDGITYADILREIAEGAIKQLPLKTTEKGTRHEVELPQQHQIKKCKSCGADIFFIKTPFGKFMPCEKQPVFYKAVSGGKQRIVTRNGDVIACEYLENPEIGMTGIGFKPHWDNCPGADQHRRAHT